MVICGYHLNGIRSLEPISIFEYRNILPTIIEDMCNFSRSIVALHITAQHHIPDFDVFDRFNTPISHSDFSVLLQTTYPCLRKRLYKALHRVERHISTYSRELPILLYTSALGAYSSMRLARDGAPDNELLIIVCLSNHILRNGSACFVLLPGIQQDRTYILSIGGLYRDPCICSPAILLTDGSAVGSVGSLLGEVPYTSCSGLHIIGGLSAGHCRGPISQRRIPLYIGHHSQVGDIPVHGVLHHHVPYNELHELHGVPTGARSDLIGKPCLTGIGILDAQLFHAGGVFIAQLDDLLFLLLGSEIFSVDGSPYELFEFGTGVLQLGPCIHIIEGDGGVLAVNRDNPLAYIIQLLKDVDIGIRVLFGKRCSKLLLALCCEGLVNEGFVFSGQSLLHQLSSQCGNCHYLLIPRRASGLPWHHSLCWHL